MDEREWLAGNDPREMLTHLRPSGLAGTASRVSDRKLRLWACACCRQVWHLLTDDRSRLAVEAAEAFVDSPTYTEELIFLHGEAVRACEQSRRSFETELAWRCAARIEALTENAGLPRWFSVSTKHAAAQASALRCIVGNPFSVPLRWSDGQLCSVSHAHHGMSLSVTEYLDPVSWLTPTALALAEAAYAERAAVQCPACKGEGLKRIDSIEAGRPLGDCPAYRGEGTFAGALDPERLLILADRLEEDGCVGELCDCLNEWCPPGHRRPHPLLAHLRGKGPHWRGCWATDLILGKQ